MKLISPHTVVSFTYGTSDEKRYVDVLHVKPDGFDGIDYSKMSADDPGYRSFKLAKIHLDSLRLIASPDEVVLPNSSFTVSTILETVGLAGQFRLDSEEDVVVIKKDMVNPRFLVNNDS